MTRPEAAWGWKGLFGSHLQLTTHPVKSEQELRREQRQEAQTGAAHWLAFTQVSYTTQGHLPRVGIARSRWCFSLTTAQVQVLRHRRGIGMKK